jgi:hypothetical protein
VTEKLDPTLCKEQVWSNLGWQLHQCCRRAVRDGYCKQHHPESVAVRRKKSAEKDNAEMRLVRRQAAAWEVVEAAELLLAEEPGLPDGRRRLAEAVKEAREKP